MYGQSFSLKTSLELSLQIYLHKNVFSINFSMNRKSMKKTDKIESPKKICIRKTQYNIKKIRKL